MINTIVETNSLQQTIPIEKKQRCGYIHLTQQSRPASFFMDVIEDNEFLNSRSISWKNSSTLPNVFILNKPNTSNLFGSAMHIQSDSNNPFGLNFEIPRINDMSELFSMSIKQNTNTESIEEIPQPISQEKTLDFIELVQDAQVSKARYWEDLYDKSTKKLVEVTPIHITNRIKTDQTIDQYYYVEQIFQMLLGFQNAFYIFDTDTLRYKQNRIPYVEDMTCLANIESKFINIASYSQQLKLYILKPPQNKLNSKIKSIIQSFIDEYENRILELQILRPNLTLLELDLHLQVEQQLENICKIFICDDNSQVNQNLYNKIIAIDKTNPYLKPAFNDLINFQLTDLERGINNQEFELQIPQFFPSDFINTFTNTIQGIALLIQLKISKLHFVDEVIELCQMKQLQLSDQINQKHEQIIQVYQQKQDQLQKYIRKFEEIQKNIQLKEQEIRRQEYERLQQNFRRQIERQKKFNDEHFQVEQYQQQSLLMQIEINRINKKYQKLFEQQEEREQQLEQELKEKKKLQKEKEQLLQDLQKLKIIDEIPEQNQQIEYQENSIIIEQEGQDQPMIKQQRILEESQHQLIDKQSVFSVQEEQEDVKVTQMQIEKSHSKQPSQSNNELIQEVIQQEFQNDKSLDHSQDVKLQLQICIGMHAKYHNEFINKALKFMLFQQLNFLSIWHNIKKYYFTQDGAYIDAQLFSVIDNYGQFCPAKLSKIELHPKLIVRHKFCYELQDFMECNFCEQLQIKIGSNIQLLLACFPSKVLNGILEFFNFVVKLRYLSHQLRNRWKDVRTTSQGQLRYQMQQFIDTYQNYIYYYVLEASFSKFIQDLSKASNLDQIIESSLNFVNSILEKSMIKTDKRSIKEAYQQCVLIITQFLQYIDYKENKNVDQLMTNFRNKSEYFKIQIMMLKSSEFFI